MKKIVFWGTPDFAVPALRTLLDMKLVAGVITQPDAHRGRSRSQRFPSPVRQCADGYGVRVLTPERLDESFVRTLRAVLPATFFILAYGKILPESIFRTSELPAINLHPSLLPDLRGPSPIQTALIKGYTQTGLTLMQLDAEVDHGPILAQKKITIVPNDTYGSLSEKLSFASSQFVAKYILRYLEGSLKPVAQDHSRATFSELLKPSDGLLDMHLNVHELHNRIRGLNPWPGTYMVWKKSRIKIIDAEPFSGAVPSSKKFFRSRAGRLCLACSDGALEVMTIQMEGKKAVNSVDFLNGHPDILS